MNIKSKSPDINAHTINKRTELQNHPFFPAVVVGGGVSHLPRRYDLAVARVLAGSRTSFSRKHGGGCGRRQFCCPRRFSQACRSCVCRDSCRWNTGNCEAASEFDTDALAATQNQAEEDASLDLVAAAAAAAWSCGSSWKWVQSQPGVFQRFRFSAPISQQHRVKRQQNVGDELLWFSCKSLIATRLMLPLLRSFS